jgi:hypothetical protein
MGKRWPIMSAVDKLPVHLGKRFHFIPITQTHKKIPSRLKT